MQLRITGLRARLCRWTLVLLAAAGALGMTTQSAEASRGICAFVFIDANGNGDYEVGEEEALDMTVCLRGPDGEVCQDTDSQGAACWLLIPEGDYQVCVESDGDYLHTTASCRAVVVTKGDIVQVLFGIKPRPSNGSHDEGMEEQP